MKHVMLALLILVAALPSAGQTPSPLGIQKGDFSASVNSEGWTLQAGFGDRFYREIVTFDQGFTSPPVVILSLTGFDATTDKDPEALQKAEAIRVHVKATRVTSAGFVIELKTWGESKVGAVWGSWIAIPR